MLVANHLLKEFRLCPGAFLCFCCRFSFFALPLPAGETAGAVLRGVVKDEAGRPVPGALIKLEDKGLQAVSDVDGRFEIAVAGAAPKVLTVMARGFFSGSRIELASDGVDSDLQIQLQREACWSRAWS